ncbi:hypothetical protein BDZ45DRAFT_477574 [Acephala macrosclerotiorum]|nr:hypothetical protein BDZ45DRAFT_477574 [Acephala macrosclerotiorum]
MIRYFSDTGTILGERGCRTTHSRYDQQPLPDHQKRSVLREVEFQNESVVKPRYFRIVLHERLLHV